MAAPPLCALDSLTVSLIAGLAVRVAPGTARCLVSLSEPLQSGVCWWGLCSSPLVVSEVQTHGSVWPCPLPTVTVSHVCWPHSLAVWAVSGQSRAVLAPRGVSGAGAQRGGQLAPRATVQLYRGRPALLQPTPSHTATASGLLTARRPLQLPVTSQPSGQTGVGFPGPVMGSSIAPCFSLAESPSVESLVCLRPPVVLVTGRYRA